MALAGVPNRHGHPVDSGKRERGDADPESRVRSLEIDNAVLKQIAANLEKGMADLRAEIRADIRELRAELRQSVAEIRADMRDIPPTSEPCGRP